MARIHFADRSRFPFSFSASSPSTLPRPRPSHCRLLGVAFLQEEDYRAAAECLRLSLELSPENEITRELFVTAIQRRPTNNEPEPVHLQSHVQLMQASGNQLGSAWDNRARANTSSKVVVSPSLTNETIASVANRFSKMSTGRNSNVVDKLPVEMRVKLPKEALRRNTIRPS